ncbi:hypothetical protein CWE11_07730 [Aliidiomarina sanyensis]|uniref:Lipoprotein n=2 Tax=Aliidiomarina sanyensis TaxID=1249555 RepID=A0A432WG37_9GAMM|nr:lipoprotein [Aliidiomarina sanyensis]RUO32659.1 hypothetical protein CWE11_07730 [Aliidiomarina sanyensis]
MLALAVLFIAAGCGQKGPLYLPEAPEQTTPESPEQSSSQDALSASEENR